MRSMVHLISPTNAKRASTCLPIVLFIFILMHYTDYDNSPLILYKPKPKIWISMSVCWSENTEMHGKTHFPYQLASKLSSELWLNRTRFHVVLQIVLKHPDEQDSVDLQHFKEHLQNLGVKVEEVYSELGCVLTSQLQRMFAFNLPYVQEEDIVITSDVDIFVRNQNYFQDIHSNKYLIWIFRYALTLEYGLTFPMSFIAMKASLWKSLLQSQSPKNLVQKFYPDMSLIEDMWNVDQTILSHLILRSGLCQAPANNTIWQLSGLKAPDKVLEDSQCFHGEDIGFCDRTVIDVKILYQDCDLWHFIPIEREAELVQKYNEIKYNKPQMSEARKLISNVKIELEKILNIRT